MQCPKVISIELDGDSLLCFKKAEALHTHHQMCSLVSMCTKTLISQESISLTTLINIKINGYPATKLGTTQRTVNKTKQRSPCANYVTLLTLKNENESLLH